jgi:hypothetical protein
MLCYVALVRTDFSEERSASFIRVTKIGELGAMLAVTSNRATWHNIQEDAILHGSWIAKLFMILLFCMPFVSVEENREVKNTLRTLVELAEEEGL